jgi:AcrR family transcriptional regulator
VLEEHAQTPIGAVGGGEAGSQGGYASLSMPAIAAEAGTSNETFYREFAGKDEAFLAAFDALAGRALRRAVPAFEGEREWPEAVGAGGCPGRRRTSTAIARLTITR